MYFSLYQIEKFGRHNVQFLNSYEHFSVFKNILTVLFRVNAIILFGPLQFLTIKLRNCCLQAALDTWRISSTIENLYKIHCSHAVAILNCSNQQTMSIFFLIFNFIFIEWHLYYYFFFFVIMKYDNIEKCFVQWY